MNMLLHLLIVVHTLVIFLILVYVFTNTYIKMYIYLCICLYMYIFVYFFILSFVNSGISIENFGPAFFQLLFAALKKGKGIKLVPLKLIYLVLFANCC